MKKTLLVTIDFWPKTGGVANYYFNLCGNLDAGRVVVLTEKQKNNKTRKQKNKKTRKQENKKTRKQENNFSFKIIRRNLIVGWMRPKWVGMFWHIWRTVKKEKIEVLWVGEVLPSGIVIYFLSKILKLPYIVSCHGNDILKARIVGRKEKMACKILAGAKCVTVNSKYTGELVKEMGVLENKIKVVYPGVVTKALKHLNTKTLINKYNLEGKRILLSVGRLVERKGFDRVIEAMPQVIEQVPEAVYLIAGDGEDMERLKHLSTKALKHLNTKALKHLNTKSLKHIIFLGKVADDEKWALMELCDVFVMPARQSKDDVEGFGIVYLEANSCGKPVIAGNVGGAKEAVIDEKTGLLVNPESAEEISDAIIKLFKNKELAEKLGRQGKERVDKKFSWEERGKVLRGL